MDENEEFEFRLRAEQEAASGGGAGNTSAVGVAPAPVASPAAPVAPSLAMAPVGGAELLLKGITGAMAAIPAGLAYGGAAVGKAVGADVDPADVMHGVQKALTYEPVSQSGQAGQNALSDIVNPIVEPVARGADAMATSVGKVSPTAETFLREAPAAAEAALGVLPLAPVASAAATAAKSAVTEGAARVGYGIEGARAAGYEVRPSDVAVTKGGAKVPGMRRESLEGTENLQREKTIKNQALTDKLAAEDMAIKDKTITPEALEKARQPHNAVYDETASKVGAYKTPDELQSTLDDIIQHGELPAKQRNAIVALKTSIDGQAALDTTRFLRSKARAFMRSDDAKTQSIGENLREASDAIETSVASRLEALGEADQFKKFQDARTSLAKINDYQTVLKGGSIDAHALMRMNMKDRGRMTGNAKTIAEAAEAAPNVTGHASKATGTGSFATVPKGKAGLIERGVEGTAKLVGKLTGTSVSSPRFQKKFGREMTATERGYAAENGKRQKIAPPRAPDPNAGLGSEALDFTPSPVAPVGTVRGGLGMELVDETPTVGGLPADFSPTPDMMTAATPAPVRYPGGLDFEASGPSLADTLAGELGLTPSPGQGERFAPIVGRDPSGVPHGDMIDFVTDGMNIAPPNLADQLGLGGMDIPQPVNMPLTPPPGRVGKPKKAGKKGGKS